MKSPGVSVRPIITLGGDHEVNQVFFDDVRVPVENLVGEDGKGWNQAKYLLEFERGGGAPSVRSRVAHERSMNVMRNEVGDSLGSRLVVEDVRSEENTYELKSLIGILYVVYRITILSDLIH